MFVIGLYRTAEQVRADKGGSYIRMYTYRQYEYAPPFSSGTVLITKA